ncbi:MAG: 23S rRNA (adenine(2503)-C(2))-methyltransferase RlmN [Candidatus Omnitrophota bacterium]
MEKIDVKNLLEEELGRRFIALGFERYRAGQVFEWVYKKFVVDIEAMKNLPAAMRLRLGEAAYVSSLITAAQQVSGDGTRKYLFRLGDGQNIESVYIPSARTSTVCISSQAGCAFACEFCASGAAGLARNLEPAEIVSQVLAVREGGFPVTNVVFMGMGEPFDNYDNVIKAVRLLNAPYALGIGQRRITISTCGIIPGIRRFADEGTQVELSVSLHSPDDTVRSRLMPVNKKYPLKALVETCREYARLTKRQVTFEYMLMKGVNDTPEDAERLAKLLAGFLSKVNIILFNEVTAPRGAYLSSERASVSMFQEVLGRRGVVATLRERRGADIDAACGQLRLRHEA